MDLMDLTPGELSHAQRKADLKVGILGVLEKPDHEGWLDAVGAVAWLILKRDDPKTTLESVMDMPLTALTELLGLDEEDGEAGRS